MKKIETESQIGFSTFRRRASELDLRHIQNAEIACRVEDMVANVIFLETPAEVGFSYDDNKKYSTDDDETSFANYAALQHFFEKFPQFKINEFYVIGESYGGVYASTLSVRILEGPANINLKGFAIGNGFLDREMLANSLVFFIYYHGLVDTELWKNLTKHCCGDKASQESCNFVGYVSSDCETQVIKVTDFLQNKGLNIYNLYSECHSGDPNSRYVFDKRNMLRYLPKSQKGRDVSYDPTCLNSSNVRKWINQPLVRKAIHIPSHIQNWKLCRSE
ncbi:lysosomal protective protein [Trichonephila clavata]|uniref:Carboxypeptidase n=1 Tax=Trichonephila clavata TaxID=2740835 RepID=A0A8X6G3P4_TRICU|nr:lysosomal protective protein [Trichonephila clavata]